MKKLFFLFCFMSGIMSLNAQTIYYWRNDQGAGDNASWSSTSPYYFWNGSAGAVPPGADIIQFEGSTGLITINDLAATNRFKLNFYNSSVSRTLNGSTTNVFYDYGGTSPLIQNWTGVLQTINFPFQIGNESSNSTPPNYAYGMHIWAGSGGLNIGSTISAANATGTIKELVLTASGTNNLTLSGVISDGSGAIKLSKWGTGTLLLSGSNSYSGVTTISDGTLKLGSPTALGSVAGSTNVISGKTLDLNGITYTNAEPLTINGTGYSSAGAVSNSSATAATFPGLLTLGAASTIIGGTGIIALTNTGTITGASDLTLDGNSGGSIASIIGINDGTSVHNLIKNGTGIWKLSGVNTYTGQTQINNGDIWIESGGDINTASAIWLGNGAALSTTAKLYLSNLTGGTTFARSINVNAGNSGTRIIGGQNTSGTNTFSGNIVRSSNQPLTIDVPNAGGTLSVSGVINGTGDIKKIGNGMLILPTSGAQNSFTTGSWLIEQGTMSFSWFGKNLNARPIILGNATDAGTVQYDGTAGAQTVPISTNAGGGKYINIPSADLSLTPTTQTQTIAGTFEIACNNTKYLELAYILSGAGGVKVSSTGTGHLILSRANIYSGATTINAGVLRLNATNAIPSGATGVQSAVTFNGGTLSTGLTSNGFSCGTSTYPMGVLTVGASGGTIALAATTSTQNLYFANSSAASWGGGTLTISGWTGTIGGTGTNGHIYIGTGTGTLTDAQLAKISFNVAGVTSKGAKLLSSGELVPVTSPMYLCSGNFASPGSFTETSAVAMTAMTGKGPNNNTSYYLSTTSTNTGSDYFKFLGDNTGTGTYYGPSANTSENLSTSFALSTAYRANGASFYIAGTSAKRYVFKTVGTTISNASAVVFDLGLSGVVQTVTSVAQSPASGSVYPGFATTVTATISGAFTGSQQAYLRYSTSSTFASSTVVAMTGSGTTYTADIPSGTNVAGTPVYYYIFTSGSAGTNPASDGSDADLFAINYNDNAGANYAYTPLASIPAITFTVASPGSGSSGYVGNTITVSGANLSGVNSLKIGGSGGTTVSSFTVVNSTTITFNAIDATGTIWLSDGTNTASSAATYTNLGYMSNADADWNTGSTWLGGAIPSAGSAVQIANAVTLNSTATNNPVSVTINSGKSLTLGASGALTINAGGFLTNNGAASLGTNGTVSFAGSASITGATTFNNLTLNGTTTLNNAPTVNGTLTLNSGTTLVTNSPVYGASSVLKYNLNNGYGAKYNTSLEWPASSGPSSVILNTNSWVQMTGDRSLTGNLTITSGALQATGALRTLTMSGTTQTITVSTTSGGAIYGTENGPGNDLQLTIANGSTTTFSGDATTTADDEKKLFNVSVNSGAVLALSRGILCKWGAFTVNGTLKINANGYVQSNNTTNSAPTNSNKSADYSGGGSLVYNTGGTYLSSDKEWPTSNSPANVTIQNSGTDLSLNSSKNISGVLTLANGTLTTDANTLTITGSIAATGGLINTGTAGTLVFAGTSEQTLQASCLTSGSVNVLTINAGVKLSTSGTISAGSLNILSDGIKGTGTLKDGGLLSSANSNIQQYLSAARNWYISSPVSGAKAKSGYTFYRRDEANNNWLTMTTGDGSASGDALNVGQGYIAYLASGTATYTFTGSLNTGNPEITIYRTAAQAIKPGFNLIGNPYPSYLNMRSIVNSTANLEKSIWYRTQKNSTSTYYFDTYNTVGNLGTNNSQNNPFIIGTVAPMQAVWVRVSAGQSSSTITFNNSYRTHANDTINPLKSKALNAAEQPILRLQVSNGTNSDEAIVYFNSNASNAYDNYDSPKMSNNSPSVPEIYLTAGGEQVSIDGLNSVQYDTELALGFTNTATQTGSFSLKASQFSSFDPGTELYLKDYQSADPTQLINLSDGKSYTFNSDAVNTTGRFALIFKAPSLTTGINPDTHADVWISMNANNQIVLNGVSGATKVAVYNELGQKILSQTLTTGTKALETKFAAGIYFVTINNTGKTITKKVIID